MSEESVRPWGRYEVLDETENHKVKGFWSHQEKGFRTKDISTEQNIGS